MKGIKKLLTGVLAATMIMSASITAFAETTDQATALDTSAAGAENTTQENGKVIIKNAIVGQTYKLYKIFDFQSSGSDSGVYIVNDKWKDFVTGNGKGSKYVNVDQNGYVSWKTDKDGSYIDGDDTPIRTDVLTANVGGAQEFAQAALEYAQNNNIEKIGDEITATANGVEFDGLSLGYYLVDSGVGALVGLNTLTSKTVTIYEKNEIPTIDKQVKEDTSGQYGDANDAEIGDTVEFKTIINAKAHSTGYVLYDSMDQGLTFNANSVKVYSEEVKDENAVAVENYSINTENPKYGSEENAVPGTFSVKFEDDYTKSFAEDTTIIVTYSATINNAAVKNTALVNKTVLEYGNKTKTNEDTTNTYVWGIKVVKYSGNTEFTDNSPRLSGAKFVIYKNVTNGVVYAKIDNNGKLTGWTEEDETNVDDLPVKDIEYFTAKNASILVSDDKGEISIEGLDADEYSLLEVEAPVGYNKLLEATDFTVSSEESQDKTLSQTGTDVVNGVKVLPVHNSTGSLLPSTGGIGTTVFYIVGGVLIVAATAYFILRRKANAQ